MVLLLKLSVLCPGSHMWLYEEYLTLLKGLKNCKVGRTYSLVVSEVVGLRVGHLGHELLVVHGRGVNLDLERLHGFLGLSHSGNLDPE